MTALVSTLETWTVSPARLRAWSDREPALSVAAFDDLTRALLSAQTPHEQKDAMLGALLRLAADDPDAVTAVVACLLPGLKSTVRRLSAGVPVDELWSELLTHLIARIRGYDLQRRPRKIAANLLLDAKSRTLAWLGTELDHAVAHRPLDNTDLPPTPPPGEPRSDSENPLAEAMAARVLSRLDAALIIATRLDQIDLADAARTCGLSYEAAKKRRQRAEAAYAVWLRSHDAAALPDDTQNKAGAA